MTRNPDSREVLLVAAIRGAKSEPERFAKIRGISPVEARKLMLDWERELAGIELRRNRPSRITQMVRGSRNLPHVGQHPGTGFMVVLVLMGALAPVGREDGFLETTIWSLGCALLMTAVFGPIYLSGCIDRADTSDRIEARERIKT